MPAFIKILLKNKGQIKDRRFVLIDPADPQFNDKLREAILKPHETPHSDLDYFLSHVDQCERTDLCWNWTHLAMQSKYASFNGWLAHRWIYSLLHGPIPSGYVIHHTCLNSRCVNPVHLKCVDKALHASLHNSLNGAESVKMWLDFTRS